MRQGIEIGTAKFGAVGTMSWGTGACGLGVRVCFSATAANCILT